ncbi:YjbQ family protein [Salinisphaera sp. USBA-960]|uniref:secondary thiamine-phosphate synthase enzyme YjbQ n=1 Tax=Salinisphaera orenii TaxID=856731 RepID=UPI000DBE52F9|nr:YjbQ family protein [Salifodinibacter halophilus]NNC26942.1 YjbQ family protein [Salifodinibacter halophilus]
MQETLTYSTAGRTTRDITSDVRTSVKRAGIATGLAHVFVRHTSASIMICENIDPEVRGDVERWFAKNVVDGDPMYEHDMEGPDDMSGHIRSILTGMELSVPVTNGDLNLGIYQGIYMYEHRTGGRDRSVVVTLLPTAT